MQQGHKLRTRQLCEGVPPDGTLIAPGSVCALTWGNGSSPDIFHDNMWLASHVYLFTLAKKKITHPTSD
jgi:hypothetical protein